MECEEDELALMGGLVNIEIGRREKRPICNRCKWVTNLFFYHAYI